MALICRRCGVELHKPTPFFLGEEQVKELNRGRGQGALPGMAGWYKVGWHVEAATDRVWDEAVCIEGMGEEWMEKVNSPDEPSESLLHIPMEVTLNGHWGHGPEVDGKLRGAVTFVEDKKERGQ